MIKRNHGDSLRARTERGRRDELLLRVITHNLSLLCAEFELLDDEAKGGDVDLLIDVPISVERPAVLAATLAARAMRVFGGRQVDVVLRAPNLAEQVIHRVALREGMLL